MSRDRNGLAGVVAGRRPVRLEVPRRRVIKGEVIGVRSASAGVRPHRLREGVWIVPSGHGKPERIVSRVGMECSSCFKDITVSVERRNDRKLAGVVWRDQIYRL